MPIKTINLGCGDAKITDAINVDMSERSGCDLVFDITNRFPLEDETFDRALFFHCIEHIEKFKHQFVLYEIHRILKFGGKLIISYPEFSVILDYWLKNKDANRKFWEKTIYGRQAYPGDYHYAAMHTPEFIELLRSIGFQVDKQFPEPGQDQHNTVIHCHKVNTPISYEEVLYREIFDNGTV